MVQTVEVVDVVVSMNLNPIYHKVALFLEKCMLAERYSTPRFKYEATVK